MPVGHYDVWSRIMSSRRVDPDRSREHVSRVQVQYLQRHRRYHTLNHIEAMLGWLVEWSPVVLSCEATESSLLAAIYHDFVYDTKRPDNEEQSAKEAREALVFLQFDQSTIETVEKLVLATKSHSPVSGSLEPESKLFLDCDLLILGSPAPIYQEYKDQIRQEYHWVNQDLYEKTRCEILKKFLARERIFFTAAISAQFEERARRNLADEIALLEHRNL